MTNTSTAYRTFTVAVGMPNYPKKHYPGESYFSLDGRWTEDNYPHRTGADNLIELRNNAENAGVKGALRRQWLKVDTDAIQSTTGVSRHKQWSILRGMAKQGEISFKRVNTDTYIRLKPGEITDIPKQREKRIKGPVEVIDGVEHYKWCMTCKKTDNLTPSMLTHKVSSQNYQNEPGDVRHYVCNDCQRDKKDNATVSFRKWETEHTQRMRYQKRSQKLYDELVYLKRKYGVPLKNTTPYDGYETS